MKSWSPPTLALAALCVLQAGFIAGRVGLEPVAHAQEPAAPRFALQCRTFVADPQKDAQLDTSDKTTEIGQWVAAREDAQWTLYSIDFEVGQKPTGYPQAWIQVCVAPAT